MAKYLYKGYKISNLGYHQPDHCVWWEAVDKDGFACFHGNTLREVEMMINDYEWECKIKAKDAEIAKRDALIKELADALEEAHDTLQDLDFCTLCTLDETCSKGVDEDEDNPFECPRLNQIWYLITKAKEVLNG